MLLKKIYMVSQRILVDIKNVKTMNNI